MNTITINEESGPSCLFTIHLLTVFNTVETKSVTQKIFINDLF